MSKEKQIEEMARDMCKLTVPCDECTMFAKKQNLSKKQFCKALQYAERAYNEGYQKIQTTDWLTKGISKEQLEKEKDESLKEFYEQNCRKYGYRRQSEIAKEIFDEIEKLSHRFMNDKYYIFADMMLDIAELKKKYTEESGNEKTKS